MNEQRHSILIAATVGLIIGLLSGYLFATSVMQNREEVIETLTAYNRDLTQRVAALEAQNRELQEKLSALTSLGSDR